MFDISFSEILVIATAALIVLGPERLPKVARTLGHLFGRAQRYVNEVKNDIQQEMELEELKKWKTSIEEAGQTVENNVQMEVNKFQEELEAEVKPESAPAPTRLPGLGKEAGPLDSSSPSNGNPRAAGDPKRGARQAKAP